MTTTPKITLYELGPTRSARVRWMLLEAGLPFDSIGNSVEVFKSSELRGIHPLGKLPAVLIDGKPLFESSAIVTAIADLVPEKSLIAAPGTWSRNLHNQWVAYALSEMEPFVQSTELNSSDFLLPHDKHIAAIIPQNEAIFRRAAKAPDGALAGNDYLVDNRFSATDVIIGYTVSWGQELRWLSDCANLQTYLARLLTREHCTLPKH